MLGLSQGRASGKVVDHAGWAGLVQTAVRIARAEREAAKRLHYCRLIGQYHARQGWGDPQVIRDWLDQLPAIDEAWVDWYKGEREPGKLPTMDEINQIRLNAATVTMAEAAQGISRIGEAFANFGVSIAESIKQGFARSMDGIYRVEVYFWLISWRVPHHSAEWISQKIPAALLPGRLVRRFQRLERIPVGAYNRAAVEDPRRAVVNGNKGTPGSMP